MQRFWMSERGRFFLFLSDALGIAGTLGKPVPRSESRFREVTIFGSG